MRGVRQVQDPPTFSAGGTRSHLVVGLFAAGRAQDDPPVELPPGGTFLDDDGSTHEGNIEAIYAAGITLGCTEDGQYFCPEDPVLRKYMAAFSAEPRIARRQEGLLHR